MEKYRVLLKSLLSRSAVQIWPLNRLRTINFVNVGICSSDVFWKSTPCFNLTLVLHIAEDLWFWRMRSFRMDIILDGSCPREMFWKHLQINYIHQYLAVFKNSQLTSKICEKLSRSPSNYFFYHTSVDLWRMLFKCRLCMSYRRLNLFGAAHVDWPTIEASNSNLDRYEIKHWLPTSGHVNPHRWALF